MGREVKRVPLGGQDAVTGAADVGDDRGRCQVCGSEGTIEVYPGRRVDAAASNPSGPPTADGWQLWETVSDGGSPISPVFSSDEALARWLTTDAACWGAMTEPMTIEQARGFVRAGFAPSLVVDADGLHDGATYVGARQAYADTITDAVDPPPGEDSIATADTDRSAEDLRRAAAAIRSGHPAIRYPYGTALADWMVSHAARLEHQGGEGVDDLAVAFASLINGD